MDKEAIIKDFDRPTPRKVCLKRDADETGVGFNPWDIFGTLGGCGGLILGVLLLLGLIPALKPAPFIAAALFAAALALLALLSLPGSLSETKYHRRLAQYGEAVVGQVTNLTSVAREDGTPALLTTVTLEYQFCTRAGQELSDKKETISGWHNELVQESDALVKNMQLVVVYLPNEPEKNEPYNSLRYRVCD
jgi:hypothetical protein